MANNVIIYVNGDSKSLTEVSPSGASVANTGNDLYIGNRSLQDRSYDGLIDEVRIYNRILSPAEVTKNYKHGKGKHS